VCTPMLSRRWATLPAAARRYGSRWMSERVGRIGHVPFEHVAHPFLRHHRLPVHAGGLIGDGQGVGDGVLGERIGSQLPVQVANSGDETRTLDARPAGRAA
jgi:hypothetical protein